MNKNTIEEYIKGVKTKYDAAKTGEFSGFLLNPSPAELKNLCLVLVDKGINKLDQEILDMFFDINDKSGKRKQIEHFEVDKLKPISNFLKGKTATTRIVNLDVIAVLVDFNPRPYRKFIAGNKEELTEDVAIKEFVKKEERVKKEDKKEGIVFQELNKKSVSKKIAFAVIPLFVFGAAGFGIKDIFETRIVWFGSKTIMKQLNVMQ